MGAKVNYTLNILVPFLLGIGVVFIPCHAFHEAGKVLHKTCGNIEVTLMLVS